MVETVEYRLILNLSIDMACVLLSMAALMGVLMWVRVLGKSGVSKRKESPAAKSKAGKSTASLTPSLRARVRSLKEKGWTNEEIAENLSINEDMVELILEVPSDDD